MNEAPLYHERYRPQFHFSAPSSRLNDPNGLVYHDGEYHLFYQCNPGQLMGGNHTWSHAVGRDLLHWEHLPDALRPYDGGTIYSGTAVVDPHNHLGVGQPGAQTLVAAYTHAREPFGQCLAWSQDRGRTWSLYQEGRPVLPNQDIQRRERDPKLLWYAPGGHWVMVLWLRRGMCRFFTSNNLREWTKASDFWGEGFYECADFFELPVTGQPGQRRWVLWDGPSHHWIGHFDGRQFSAESAPHTGDYGPHHYAAQTWSNTGERCYQIAWMLRGLYPEMPFNQQLSIPCELTLRPTPRGLRLFRQPLAALASLRGPGTSCPAQTLAAGAELALAPARELLDWELELSLTPGATCELLLHQAVVTLDGATLACAERLAPLEPVAGRLRLRLLLDRTSLEIFGHDGAISHSSCWVPETLCTVPRLRALGGAVTLHSSTVYPLRGVWG